MSYQDILSAIDHEIARLTEARELLSTSSTAQELPDETEGKVRRPRSTQQAAAKTPTGKRGRRVMSEESRQRIAEAQRKRHAARKQPETES